MKLFTKKVKEAPEVMKARILDRCAQLSNEAVELNERLRASFGSDKWMLDNLAPKPFNMNTL